MDKVPLVRMRYVDPVVVCKTCIPMCRAEDDFFKSQMQILTTGMPTFMYMYIHVQGAWPMAFMLKQHMLSIIMYMVMYICMYLHVLYSIIYMDRCDYSMLSIIMYMCNIVMYMHVPIHVYMYYTLYYVYTYIGVIT